jgi:hypothetical protein
MTVVGTAMIPWQDIETIGSTRIQAHKMIGIRLKKYDGYINNMSSELADLINKSLPLVRLASIGISFLNIPIYAKALAAFEGRENPARTLRKIGRVGNLAESMIFCRQTYGYDILFAWTELDRPASEFIKLLESYRTAWSSLESAPHKPFGSQWNPGQPHPNYPNVIASKEEGKWHPAPGYNWMDVQKNLQVKWFPGQPHRNYPNVIASQKEGEWLAAPGYEWANPTDAKDLQVVWSPGQNHPKYPSVIAGDDEKWYPAPGYKWVDVQKDLRVVWEPGQVHREHPNLVSGQKEGEWQTSTTENNRTASSSQSEKLITVCPICSQKLRAPIDRGILTLSCPKCNHSWRWSPSSGRL